MELFLQGVVMMELNSVLANPIDIESSFVLENGTFSQAQTSESPHFNVSIFFNVVPSSEETSF